MKIQMFWMWKQQEVVPVFILFELAETDELNIDVPMMALLLFFLAQADKTLISWALHGHWTTPMGPPLASSAPCKFKGHGYADRGLRK